MAWCWKRNLNLSTSSGIQVAPSNNNVTYSNCLIERNTNLRWSILSTLKNIDSVTQCQEPIFSLPNKANKLVTTRPVAFEGEGCPKILNI